MRKTNRLIEDFRKQTKATVCKHMNALATTNYSLYSTYVRGYQPVLAGNDVYFYSDGTTVVMVCLHCCGKDEEKVYKESEEMGAFIYREGKEPRVSMVWKMSEAIQQIKESLLGEKTDVAVYAVLLTEATILNADEMEKIWDHFHIKVIDGFSSLKNREIAVNEDGELEGMMRVTTILASSVKILEAMETAYEKSPEFPKVLYKQDPDDKPDYDPEFKRMLDDFIRREYDKEFGGKASDDDEMTDDDENITDDDESLAEDDEDLAEDELTSDVFLKDNNDEPDEVFIPDGTIEQNNNVSVQVEILRPIANPREELEKLIGCNDIKRRIDELLALTSYNTLMRGMFPECKQHAVSLHSIFLGRPGTGKTTVCKIYGSLLRQAGALSKGHVVVCDRGTFIGTLWGDEERSVRQVIEKARGGVLMIDEAYLLNSENERDPGRAVLQLLMNIMADETQRDIAIVLCGYKEPMMKMLTINPGLLSRLPNKFEFQDFTVEELLQITKLRVQEYKYLFTDQAWEQYIRLINDAYKVRDPQTWGNARFVANQLERIYLLHAQRCVRQQPKDKLSWRLITPDDIVPIEVPKQRVRIGF